MQENINWVKGVDYPNFMLERSLTTLRGGYLIGDETPKDAIQRMVNRVVELTDPNVYDGDLKGDLFQALWTGDVCASTPVWSNFGTSRGLPISCFGSFIPDSISGIYGSLQENAKMSQLGGGTSSYWGDLRERGSGISGQIGTSSGAFEFMKDFDGMISRVSQGGTRRGSHAVYIPFDHGDLEEILEIKHVGCPIQELFYGVSIRSEDYDKILNGDEKALSNWAKILESRAATGIPYIFNHDNANSGKSTPEWYGKDYSKIVASNLCFTGDTPVKTVEGIVPIKRLAEYSKGEIKFKVPSASEDKSNSDNYWKNNINEAVAFKTGTKEVVEVTLSNGDTFKCTPDHPLGLNSGGYIEAKDSVGRALQPIFSLSEDDNMKVSDFRDNAAINEKDLTVIKVEDAGIEDVYDLTVDNDHNFYIITCESGNSYRGILVHNCSEIMLPSNELESFVCCLLSMNAARFDHWKKADNRSVELAIIFMDAIMEDFILKTAYHPDMKRARRFAQRHRALGLGILGYSTYLQMKEIPFTSLWSTQITKQMFGLLKQKAEATSTRMAEVLGNAPFIDEYNIRENKNVKRRHTTLIAVAPTTSNATIAGGVSPGIEPLASNYYVQKSAKGNFTIKNSLLEKVIRERYPEKDNLDTWNSIRDNAGSVQHLTWLSENERDVFKTFSEINQFELVRLAAVRQEYIDQGQSLNVHIDPDVDPSLTSALYLMGAKLGVKAFYYQRSKSVLRESDTDKPKVLTMDASACVSCEG